VREWKALVWGGVISEVGWLSLCGAPPRSFFVAPRNLVVWVGESGSGRHFPEVETVHGWVVASPKTRVPQNLSTHARESISLQKASE
jgi:hypothetical protein